jgi:hypothetical protein
MVLSLYATAISFEDLARFFNLTKHWRYIDIDNLILINNMKISKETHAFVLNEEIKRTFDKYIRYSPKNCCGILYHNTKMTSDTIASLKDIKDIARVVIVDYWKNPLIEHLYPAADEVIRI